MPSVMTETNPVLPVSIQDEEQPTPLHTLRDCHESSASRRESGVHGYIASIRPAAPAIDHIAVDNDLIRATLVDVRHNDFKRG